MNDEAILQLQVLLALWWTCMGCVTGQTTATGFFSVGEQCGLWAGLLLGVSKPICRNMSTGIRIRDRLSPFLAATPASV